ncbi:MAG: PIN domain-containing protein [bacterium]|nr:PIN domain-containing protein [bacterium]
MDADDRHHKPSLELLLTHPGLLVVPALVVTEVSYLVATRLGTDAEVRFLGDLASGQFRVEPVAAGDWLRMAELVHTYRNLPLGAVDASGLVAAERLGITAIATTNQRDFAVVQPRHCDAFTLLP